MSVLSLTKGGAFVKLLRKEYFADRNVNIHWYNGYWSFQRNLSGIITDSTKRAPSFYSWFQCHNNITKVYFKATIFGGKRRVYRNGKVSYNQHTSSTVSIRDLDCELYKWNFDHLYREAVYWKHIWSSCNVWKDKLISLRNQGKLQEAASRASTPRSPSRFFSIAVGFWICHDRPERFQCLCNCIILERFSLGQLYPIGWA